VEDLYNYKTLIGELLGAAIAVVWIAFAFLGAGSRLFLVVAISLTILLGTSSGGLIAISQYKNELKEIVGWVLGASIGVVWICFALFYSMLGYWEGRMFLVAAISLTILLGTLSGGLHSLSGNNTPIES